MGACSRREAEFLTLVLLHSGYPPCRQHAAFFSVEDGARTTEFVRVPLLIGGFDLAFVYVQRFAPLGAFTGFLNAYTPLLRRLPHAVQGPCYEIWYDRWRLEGDAAQPPLRTLSVEGRAAPGGQLVPHILSDRYPISGRIQEAA